ncbi:MAG: acyl-CoA dehydrogenase family protein [Aeropyrum sp.]|nr:acyl-CoA dehydrogenase family protein [Aeropyrum sp.]
MPLSSIEDLTPTYGLNHYTVDRPLQKIYRALAGSNARDFTSLGRVVGSDLYEAAYRVDRLSKPHLITWGYRGVRVDKVWLDPLERRVLEDLVLVEGVNRFPYTGGSWVDHYASLYLVSDPGIGCIITITMQTAYALYKYAPEEIRSEYKKLAGIEKPPSWGATWFTERQGGSDLGANETVARHESGNIWRLTGYKYFASGAGIADIALVTARPPGAPPGAKGLELFAVPREYGGSLNFEVTRLKWKSGTVSVPTGEVELKESAGYLLGEKGKGIYYTLEDLMVSRLANSISAAGTSRKAYLEAALYASERRAFGRRLVEHELVRRDLLEMEVDIRAMTALALKAAHEFDKSWKDTPPYSERYHYARLLTHIAKNLTAEMAKGVTATAMELWGGIGFLHEFPIERLHREAMILPIWEGTSNIQALDMLEAMHKKGAHKTLLRDLSELARTAMHRREAWASVEMAKEALAAAASLDPSEVEYRGKDLLRTLGRIVSFIVLDWIAGEYGDEVMGEAALIYYKSRVKGGEFPRPEGRVLEELTSLDGGLNIY